MPMKRMIWAVQINHFKQNSLHMAIISAAKQDINLDFAHWRAGQSRNYVVEGCAARFQHVFRDAQRVHGMPVHDVDVAAIIN